MKLIHKTPIPACDICKATARYDAPTIGRGAWAYMCTKCYEVHASAGAANVGYEFTSVPTDCTIRAEKIALAIEDGNMELLAELVGDGDINEYF